MDGIGFTFSQNAILNFYFVLAVLLFGYLFHLIIGDKLKKEKKIPKTERKENGMFFDILAFGLATVGIVFFISIVFSINAGGEILNRNVFIPYFLLGTISVSVTTVFSIRANIFPSFYERLRGGGVVCGV